MARVEIEIESTDESEAADILRRIATQIEDGYTSGTGWTVTDDDRIRVYTGEQTARLFGVAPRTVRKWFDSGRLKGYRVPGSNALRFPRENLIAFAQEHGMPVPAEL